MNRESKLRTLRILQYIVAIGAFAFVARKVDWPRVLDQMVQVEGWVLLVIVTVTTLEFGARFSTWIVLIQPRQSISFWTAARIDLVIKFINHLIPSKASGHSIAPLVIHHYTNRDWPGSVSTAALNTGLYASLYGLVALGGIILFATYLSQGLFVVLLFSAVTYAVVGILVLSAGWRLDLLGIIERFTEVISRIPRVGPRLADIAESVPAFTTETAADFRDLSRRPVLVLKYALLWTGNIMVFPGIRVWVLFVAFGGSFFNPWLLPIVLVLAYGVTVLPVTPGGVGIAEASATLVFVSLGVNQEIAVIAVLIDRTLGVYLPAILGWIPMLDLGLEDLLKSSV